MVEERVTRRLAAILAADVLGYSRLMGQDEVGTRARFNTVLDQLVSPAIRDFNGRLFKTMGDGLLVEFASVVDAVECAVKIQNELQQQEQGSESPLSLRIGINLGDVIVEGADIHGDGVNIAARLEGLAAPGGICVSEIVYRSLEGKLALDFTDIGPQQVKNIAKPVHAFHLEPASELSAPSGGNALCDKPTIAVLPFKNLSRDPEHEVFAGGLTEDLILALSFWHTFYVISRHSTFQYQDKAPDLATLSRDLGAQYVLEGSVRTAGDRIRITAQLIDVETSRHAWTKRYDRQIADFFDLQDEIAQAIAAHVEPAFAKAEQKKAVRKPSQNLASWEWYQKGIATLDGFFKAESSEARESNRIARECFERAIELDPSDSNPVAYLAYAHFRAVLEGFSSDPASDINRSIEISRRAVTLDDANPYAHFAYSIGLTYSGRPDLGIPEARRAVELNPNYSHAYIPLGNGLNLVGKPAEAVEYLEKAVGLNPTDPRNHAYFTFLAEAHLNNRNYNDAINWAHRAIERNAEYPFSYVVLASALGHSGNRHEAEQALKTGLTLRPDCIEHHPQLPLFKNPEDRDHILDGLRKAGFGL